MPHLHDHTDTKRNAAGAKESAPRFNFRIVTVVPQERHHALDHALEETFPASDPVSITITEIVRVMPEWPELN